MSVETIHASALKSSVINRTNGTAVQTSEMSGTAVKLWDFLQVRHIFFMNIF